MPEDDLQRVIAGQPEDHLARFVADFGDAERDLTAFYASCTRTKGRAPYDPRMMLYDYCTWVRSSRKLEKTCTDVVAVRWLAAGAHPDFRALSRCRTRHLQALSGVFVQTLMLCREAGMVTLGAVALDRTKVQAHAFRRKAISYQRLVSAQEQRAEEAGQLATRQGKHVLLRGLQSARCEWDLVTGCHNL